jgi:hypothetical protein
MGFMRAVNKNETACFYALSYTLGVLSVRETEKSQLN